MDVVKRFAIVALSEKIKSSLLSVFFLGAELIDEFAFIGKYELNKNLRKVIDWTHDSSTLNHGLDPLYTLKNVT